MRPTSGMVLILSSFLPVTDGWIATACAQTPLLQAERYKNLGIAYLEEDRPIDAEPAFRRVIELAPGEALGYANLGIALLRLGQLDAAASQLEQARRVDPGSVEVLLLAAEVQFSSGQWELVATTTDRVLELDPKNVMALYYQYRTVVAQRNEAEAQQKAHQTLEQLYQLVPDNLVIEFQYARSLATRKQWQTLGAVLKQIEPVIRDDDKLLVAWDTLREAVVNSDSQAAERSLRGIENSLRSSARYRHDLSQLQPPVAGLPVMQFSPRFRQQLEPERPHGVSVTFVPVAQDQLPQSSVAVEHATQGGWDFADVNGDGRVEWLVGYADGSDGTLQLWQHQEADWSNLLQQLALPATEQARLVDFDSDGRFEAIGVGSRGAVLLCEMADGNWQPKPINSAEALAPWSALEVFDADNEGDLDLLLGGDQGCRLWQNRGDATFVDITERSGLMETGAVRRAVATDHDDDLDTDLLLIVDDGRLQLWDNRRHGHFVAQLCGLSDLLCKNVIPRDFDNDGYEDLLLVLQDGRLAMQLNQAGVFQPPVMLPVEGLQATCVAPLDMDNDGWLDVAVAGQQREGNSLIVLRNQGDATWAPLSVPFPPGPCAALAAIDMDRDGDEDLVAVDSRGTIRAWRNDGGNTNHWLRVELRGLRMAGSKNNLHGIGSKIEIKAGLFYQMRFVRSQYTHFGLGTHVQADLMRVVWSNGIPQNHLQPVADQTIREPQVLKGSCPYLYGWNGEEFEFITDTLAGAPLGLQVAEGVIAPDNPRELLTIPGAKLAPKSGEYLFQYTSELWETVYLDEVALWAIDHPASTEVFTDERFLPPPYVAPQPILTRGRVMPARATDTQDRDVTAAMLKFDHNYPETLQPTRYQGVVEPHHLTLQFGDVSGLSHPLLVIGCWIFWTDTSINVARSQNPADTGEPTVVEVWHPGDGWHPIERPFGLPNGKDKWVVIDVADQIAATDARIRLRSESQIYWDQAFLVDRIAEPLHRTTVLSPCGADVHFGGFNELYRPVPDGPHLYRYGRQDRHPVWMDMSGWATRYGDVTRLLTDADDRFVIFTGGDEVTIRFQADALPALPAGWERDFLFYSDGWEKDSDRNTMTGETVEPLPFHGMSAYPYPSSESYPRDDVHRDYLNGYNTRRIGPESFRRYVKEYRPGQPTRLPWQAEPAVRGEHSQ